jgi:hypothetical protein
MFSSAQGDVNGSAQQSKVRELKFFDKTYSVPDSIPFWRAQLDKVIENNDLLMEKSGLKLVRYSYIAKVVDYNDLAKWKTELLKGDLYLPTSKKEKGLMPASIEYKELLKGLLDTYMPSSKYDAIKMHEKFRNKFMSKHIYDFKENDMGVVKVEWNSNGVIFNTICFVAESNGIIFDNVLTTMTIAYFSSSSVSKTNSGAEAGEK